MKNITIHLRTPTDETPLILNDLELYDSFFLWDNSRYSYNDIGAIVFKNSIERLYGIKTKESIYSAIIIPKYEDDFSEEEDILIPMFYTPIFPVLRDKSIEQIQFMVEYMRVKSFQSRYNRTQREAERTGKIVIGGVEFRNNGDLATIDGVFVNIVEAFKKDLIEYGESWEGLKSSSIDPYNLIIYENSKPQIKLFGIDLNDKYEIPTFWNKDINDLVIKNLLSKGSLF